MRKKNYFVGGVLLMTGVVSFPVLADVAQSKQYQFPQMDNSATPTVTQMKGVQPQAWQSATSRVNPQGAGVQQYPVYTYPQAMQTYRQPMYYGYPTAAYYYPQMRQGQPMTAMPYVYPGMQMQPQQRQQTAQAPQPVSQYRSPYNPNIPATPGPKPPPQPQPEKVVKPWGDTRYIWPDFYTDFTSDFWDEMINAPNKMGYMPGGWRFPSLSSPDPVTVGDAVANQMPPIMDEGANFIDFAN